MMNHRYCNTLSQLFRSFQRANQCDTVWIYFMFSIICVDSPENFLTTTISFLLLSISSLKSALLDPDKTLPLKEICDKLNVNLPLAFCF